jgi:hypothetical protein
MDRMLYVLRLVSKRAPTGPGDWAVWSFDAQDAPLKDIKRVDETFVPDYMEQSPDSLPKSFDKARKGFAWRQQIVRAFCFVDLVGAGHESDFVFNERIVTSDSARFEAQRSVLRAIGKNHGWESHLRKMFHQYCHFAGAPGAMLALHGMKGGKKQERTGKLSRKCGRLSDEELREKRRHEATGRPVRYKRRPVNEKDHEKFLDVLTRYWAEERMTMAETYARMVEEHYADASHSDIPSIDAFIYHANKYLIPKHDLHKRRNRQKIHEQYFAPRAGTATDYTQGAIEIADVDGFTPKLAIEVKIKGKVRPTYVKVIFAVSRNWHTVLGAEVVLRGESAEAYRRCIASIYLDKKSLANELGLDSADGLVTGTIDGVFADNGAGAALENVEIACGEMRLGFEIAPPGRGDYKAVIENINSLMVWLMERWSSGYNRRRDKVQQELRREAKRSRPIPYKKFVKLLWMAIQHHNLTADRSYLRDTAMLLAGEDGSPAELWADAQKKRRGDAARKLTPREVFSRFVPWKKYKVRRGVVYFKKKLRYSSPELKEYAKNRANESGANGKPCIIKVKRLDGTTSVLVWRKDNGEEGLLKLFDEDARKVGHLSWGEYNLTAEANSIRVPGIAANKRTSSNRLTVQQHAEVSAADSVRRANGDWSGLEGQTVNDAKTIGTAVRDREWGAKHVEALGISAGDIAFPTVTQPASPNSGTADQDYAARIRAQRAARKKGGTPVIQQ